MKRERPRRPSAEMTRPVMIELPPTPRTVVPVEQRPGFERGAPSRRPRHGTLVENRRNIPPQLPPDPGGGRLPPLRRINPKVGEHPDLFEGTTWRDAATGEVTARSPALTPIHVPMDQLTDEELEALPSSAFSKAEWDELDEDIAETILAREKEEKIAHLVGKPLSEIDDEIWADLTKDYQQEILEHSPLVVELIERFVDQWKTQEGDNQQQYMLERASETLDALIADQGGTILHEARRGRRTDFDVEDMIQSFMADGFSEETVEAAIEEALQDNNNWDVEESNGWGGFFNFTEHDGFYVDSSDWRDLTKDMDELEIHYALNEIDLQTHLQLLYDYKRNGFKYGIDVQEVFEYSYSGDPDWDKIAEAAQEALSDTTPDGDIPELSKDDPANIVYRYKDGAYVYDVPFKELPHEGKRMGHCVGKPGMGYGRAVQQGEIKIFSIRTEAGRPKFTIQAELDHNGNVVDLLQFKGKSNRKPGWDLGREYQGQVKEEEVRKAVEFIKFLNLEPTALTVYKHTTDWSNRDLESGYKVVFEGHTGPKPNRRNPAACPAGHEHKACIGFCQPYRP